MKGSPTRPDHLPGNYFFEALTNKILLKKTVIKLESGKQIFIEDVEYLTFCLLILNVLWATFV